MIVYPVARSCGGQLLVVQDHHRVGGVLEHLPGVAVQVAQDASDAERAGDQGQLRGVPGLGHQVLDAGVGAGVRPVHEVVHDGDELQDEVDAVPPALPGHLLGDGHLGERTLRILSLDTFEQVVRPPICPLLLVHARPSARRARSGRLPT